jgi:putative membrane protein
MQQRGKRRAAGDDDDDVLVRQRHELLGVALLTVSMILFWGAVIFGVIALVRYFGRSGQQPAAPPPSQSAEWPSSPERLLAERFARGEIDEDEYRQRLTVLRGADQPANGQARPPAGTSTRLSLPAIPRPGLVVPFAEEDAMTLNDPPTAVARI